MGREAVVVIASQSERTSLDLIVFLPRLQNLLLDLQVGVNLFYVVLHVLSRGSSVEDILIVLTENIFFFKQNCKSGCSLLAFGGLTLGLCGAFFFEHLKPA